MASSGRSDRRLALDWLLWTAFSGRGYLRRRAWRTSAGYRSMTTGRWLEPPTARAKVANSFVSLHRPPLQEPALLGRTVQGRPDDPWEVGRDLMSFIFGNSTSTHFSHGRRLGGAAAACPTLVRRPTLVPSLPTCKVLKGSKTHGRDYRQQTGYRHGACPQGE